MPKTKKNKSIELEKEVKTSIISVQRQYSLSVDFQDPKTQDELYMTVPEVTRAIDLRGAAVISRGYEIKARDDSQVAKDYANLCAFILEKSGGVSFIEQWQRNADLYGNGYVELANLEKGDKIDKLVHVHPYAFGYELEEYNDQGEIKTRIKLDPATQEPVGFATYKYNENKQIWENDKLIPLEKIAHLKYKTTGDSIYGVSLIQPMQGSILRKLKLEQAIEDAGRSVAAPKIVISGDFESDDDALETAKEAASLDINDVVVLQNEKTFEIINPGQIALPELRSIFVYNICTAAGIPMPLLTSEGNDINKATMSELTRSLRDNMRSNMNKIQHIIENVIFKRIGENYGITDYQKLIPSFRFPEDLESEDEIIKREEKKAATLTSLSNSIQILSNVFIATGSELKTEIIDSLKKTLDLYNKTIETFTINNDQTIGKIEEDFTQLDEVKELTLNSDYTAKISAIPDDVLQEKNIQQNIYSSITLQDEIDFIKQPKILKRRHDDMHILYQEVQNGTEIIDYITNEHISLPAIVQRHRYYIELMRELGILHEPSDIGQELDLM